MTHAAQRLIAVALAGIPLTLAGCQGGKSAADGDQPGVIVPAKGSQPLPGDASAARTTTGGDAVIARLESVTVKQSELVPLLYDAYGLDGLLKLLQRNLARAEAVRRGLTVSATDLDAERKLTLRLAFPGQDESDYDNLLKQLLQRERVSRAEFDVVMDTNAHLRACVRGQAASDVTTDAIRNEFNLIYGERVRVRDIAVETPQQAAEVQRLLSEPGARFETIARNMGKIPELAQIGGQLPEFSRTSTTWSPTFVEAAFGLQKGQISDPILEKNFYHIL
jgi:parvulin-like peptidyl-prolyl isomerase